jgi:integrase
MFTPAELDTFFQACTPEQALVYRTFLRTGMRETELVYLQREDINAATGELMIRDKPSWGWSPKSWEARNIQIDDELLAELLAHVQTHEHKLVFPTVIGGPNMKLLRTMKRICERAGLPEDEWWLHALRSTFATNALRDGLGIPEVQRLLGHAPGSSSIWRYVRAMEGEQLRDKINEIRRKKAVA